MNLSLTSPAFHDGGEIPARYTCKGADVSPWLLFGSLTNFFYQAVYPYR